MSGQCKCARARHHLLLDSACQCLTPTYAVMSAVGKKVRQMTALPVSLSLLLGTVERVLPAACAWSDRSESGNLKIVRRPAMARVRKARAAGSRPGTGSPGSNLVA